VPLALHTATRAALAGAAFFLAPAFAAADPVAPSVLVSALDVYVDWVVASHNGALSCAAANSKARDDAEWTSARSVFVATLWANGFPADFVTSADKRLAAQPVTVSCGSVDAFIFAGAENDGWQKTFAYPLQAMDLRIVAKPVPAETWTSIKALITEVLPQQTRLFDCLAVVFPATMPTMVHDWDDMIVKLGGSLVGAGLPHDEITAALSAAEANSLWHRAAPEKVADLVASCQADQKWQDNFANFGFLGLGPHIENDLLPKQPPPDGDSDQ
jgi:hypothetical protein